MRTSARFSRGAGNDAVRNRLASGFASRGVVRNNQLHTKTLTNLPIQWVTVVSAVAHQSFGSLGEETLLDRGSDELCFVRRSAGLSTATCAEIRGIPYKA